MFQLSMAYELAVDEWTSDKDEWTSDKSERSPVGENTVSAVVATGRSRRHVPHAVWPPRESGK
jgi:hypothetical protein